MRYEVVERAVFHDELARALLADPGHALDVVDRVAHEREHVDDLLGRDTELLLHGSRVVPRAFVARVEHTQAVVHELVEVLVHRHDDDVEACGGRLHGQRPDDVVGLIILGIQNGYAQRFAGGVNHRNLHGQLVGHRRAEGLVVRHDVIAKGPAGQIERGRDVRRLVVRYELPQHRHEDVDRVGRHAGGVAQHAAVRRADRRMERAIHLGAAVDEIKERLGGHVRPVEDFCTISPAMMRIGRAAVLLAAVLAGGCAGGGGVFRQYEYQEDIYLALDGTATIYVSSSVAALDALRGLSLDTNPDQPVAAQRAALCARARRRGRRPAAGCGAAVSLVAL